MWDIAAHQKARHALIEMAKTKSPGPHPLLSKVARHRWALLVAFCLLFIGADQISKIAAQQNLARAVSRTVTLNDGQQLQEVEVIQHQAVRSKVIIKDFFELRYVQNDAAAFSLASSFPENVRMPVIFVIFGIVLLLLMLWYSQIDRDGLLIVGVIGLVSGGVSNAIDRIRLGYVIDFIDIFIAAWGRDKYSMPTFNFADVCVLIGALCIAYRTFRPLAEASSEAEEQAHGNVAKER